MPYDPNNPPKKLAKLPENKQRQWVHVFNEAIAAGDDEGKAHAKAWGVVKEHEADPTHLLIEFNKGFFSSAAKTPPKGFSQETRRAFGRTGKQEISQNWHSFRGKMRRRNPDTGKVEYKPMPSRLKEPKQSDKKEDVSISEAKYDKKTDSMQVTTSGGKKYKIPMKNLKTLPQSLQRKLLNATVAASHDLLDLFKDLDAVMLAHLLETSATEISPLGVIKDDDDSISSDEFSDASFDDQPKIDVSTPSGARAMALGLTRILGGWKGGCRLSPSANRRNLYHITVFCESPEEVGRRIMQLRDHLLGDGYKEVEEGTFRRGGRTVYQGRTYARRRGSRPMAFMVTVENKDE